MKITPQPVSLLFNVGNQICQRFLRHIKIPSLVQPKMRPHLPLLQTRINDGGYLPCLDVPIAPDEISIHCGGRKCYGVDRSRQYSIHIQTILPLPRPRAHPDNRHLPNTTPRRRQNWVRLPRTIRYHMEKHNGG